MEKNSYQNLLQTSYIAEIWKVIVDIHLKEESLLNDWTEQYESFEKAGFQKMECNLE